MQLHIQTPVLTWDEAKRLRNLTDHGVDFRHLESFFDGHTLTREDDRIAYGEQRFESVGVSNGVCLVVVWSLRDAETVRIISARRALKHETQNWYAHFSKFS
jgi:uncharacterized DUF497 family protein